MRYRICKAFEIESGHMLSKHAERCRYPHGHSRRVEIVLSSESLDANDMVCDFKALKLALSDHLDAYDHAMVLNADDPAAEAIGSVSERVILYEGEDPTTEVMARRIYEFVAGAIAEGRVFRSDEGHAYRLPEHVRVERVRVGETSSSWAEYALG